MEILTTEKRTTWAERLISMEVGEWITIDMKTSNTVSASISRTKQFNPEMNWTLKKVRENGNGRHIYATVTRLA